MLLNCNKRLAVVDWVVSGVGLLCVCLSNNDLKLFGVGFEMHPNVPAQYDIVIAIVVIPIVAAAEVILDYDTKNRYFRDESFGIFEDSNFATTDSAITG